MSVEQIQTLDALHVARLLKAACLPLIAIDPATGQPR